MLPSADPHEPGPFALSDPDRTCAILTEAGFKNVIIQCAGRPARNRWWKSITMKV